MDAVLIVLIIFGSITIWVRGFPSILSAAKGGGRKEARRLQQLLDASTAEVKALRAENSKNEVRLQTLEGIVCDVDFELNRKLARLATQALALPAPESCGGTPVLASAPQSNPGASSPPAQSGARPHARTEAAPSAGVLSAGTRVGDRFVVEELLGSGAMGEVYAAYDETLDNTVALKVMAGLSLMEPDAVERFRREASAARRISHPNVVRLHDLGVDRGIHFISMERVKGESLRQRLDREGVLGLSEIRELVAQICDALEAAHGAGVVHRDLKPDNVLIDREGKVRVIDFGVAKLPYVKGVTATGVVMGTPEYMSPEQVQGKEVDGRSDLYSLGAIVFHMVAGSPPFKGDSPIAVGIAHCTDPVPALAEYRDVPRPWQDFILRAMAKPPADRFPTG
ncbi:MAG: serine/threonine-protein kinase, partial [Myxococcales bacterium]|nr:serine/threonine-protein kinase [Myxococcales bacterium]